MTELLLRLLDDRQEGRLQRFFRRRLESREDAADATQETLLRVLEASHGTLIENPQAYLYQVAKSVARITIARRSRDAILFVAPEEGVDQPDDAPLADRIVMARQGLSIMARAIEELPARCQQVFILSRLRGLSNGEIAVELGISRNMVEKHIIRALMHCRKTRSALLL